MAHANARLNAHGRLLLVERVIEDGPPGAHLARELGMSRQCAHRWVNRYRVAGEAGLVEARILQLRRDERKGQDWIGPELGVSGPVSLGGLATSPSSVSVYSRPADRRGDPILETDGETLRTAQSRGPYTHGRWKAGRILTGGGWEAHGRQMGSTGAKKRAWIGFNYIHSLVDDHSRLAYSEVLPDEEGSSCVGFLLRASGYFAEHDITTIREVMTDNHWSYSHSNDVAAAMAVLRAKHIFIKHCPWQNEKSSATTAPCNRVDL